MQIIPVIDLKGGVVVRGVAGQRAKYRPVDSVLDCDATPESVARAFARHFKFQTVYVADLDAIAGAEPDRAAYEAIASYLPILIIDAGVSDADPLAKRFFARSVNENSERIEQLHCPPWRVEPRRGEGNRDETSRRPGSTLPERGSAAKRYGRCQLKKHINLLWLASNRSLISTT